MGMQLCAPQRHDRLHFQVSFSLSPCLAFFPSSFHLSRVANPSHVFTNSFLAIIPLAKLLGFGTEEIALRVGQALGGCEFRFNLSVFGKKLMTIRLVPQCSTLLSETPWNSSSRLSLSSNAKFKSFNLLCWVQSSRTCYSSWAWSSSLGASNTLSRGSRSDHFTGLYLSMKSSPFLVDFSGHGSPNEQLSARHGGLRHTPASRIQRCLPEQSRFS